MDEKMWGKLLTIEMVQYMQIASEGAEDEISVMGFYEFIKKEIPDYRTLVVMAMHWKTYDENRQVRSAISHAGELNASRFIMMMEYLSYKFIKGELK